MSQSSSTLPPLGPFTELDIYRFLNSLLVEETINQKSGSPDTLKPNTPYSCHRFSRVQRILHAHGIKRNTILIDANVALLERPAPFTIPSWDRNSEWEALSPGKQPWWKVFPLGQPRKSAHQKKVVSTFVPAIIPVYIAPTVETTAEVEEPTYSTEVAEAVEKGGKVTKSRAKKVKPAPYTKEKSTRKAKAITAEHNTKKTTRAPTLSSDASPLPAKASTKKARSPKTHSAKKSARPVTNEVAAPALATTNTNEA